jgi:DNA-binding response OmpR family regulator
MARILIVDDEVDLVDACSDALADRGHSVVTVTDGRHALATARQEPPDLVMLDWVMPGLDGGVVLGQLRNDSSIAGTPVLVISALPDGARRARAAGADDFLAKPFDVDELAEKVTSLLQPRPPRR